MNIIKVCPVILKIDMFVYITTSEGDAQMFVSFIWKGGVFMAVQV